LKNWGHGEDANVGRREDDSYREKWWEGKLAAADTPKKKVTVLQAKILADIQRLPENEREEALELAAVMLENLVDEIAIRVHEERWTA
jgi:hypothetical protein